MPTLRRNRVRGAPAVVQTRSEGVARIEVAAVRNYWESLSTETRLKKLHFEDRKLVEPLFRARQALWLSQLVCMRHGVKNNLSGKAAMMLTMEGFNFDFDSHSNAVAVLQPSARLQPTAFFATHIFVNTTSLFHLLDEELEGFLPPDRPTPDRRNWASDPWFGARAATPSSWRELLRRILRLVELAILEAYLAAVQNDRDKVDQNPDVEPLHVIAAQDSCIVDASLPSESLDGVAKPASCDRLVANSEASSTQKGRYSSPLETRNSCLQASHTGEDDSPSSPCSRSTHSELSTDICSTASVASTPNYSSGDEISDKIFTGTRWAWISNSCSGDAVEWQWSHLDSGSRGVSSRNIEPQPGDTSTAYQVSIKNTFLHESLVTKTRPRARSLGLPVERKAFSS